MKRLNIQAKIYNLNLLHLRQKIRKQGKTKALLPTKGAGNAWADATGPTDGTDQIVESGPTRPKANIGGTNSPYDPRCAARHIVAIYCLYPVDQLKTISDADTSSFLDSSV